MTWKKPEECWIISVKPAKLYCKTLALKQSGVIEPQNHSLGEVGDVKRSPVQHLIVSARRSNQVAWAFLQLSLENLQGWRLYNISGQPAPMFDCPHGEKVFLISCQKLSCFNLSSLSSYHLGGSLPNLLQFINTFSFCWEPETVCRVPDVI